MESFTLDDLSKRACTLGWSIDSDPDHLAMITLEVSGRRRHINPMFAGFGLRSEVAWEDGVRHSRGPHANPSSTGKGGGGGLTLSCQQPSTQSTTQHG